MKKILAIFVLVLFLVPGLTNAQFKMSIGPAVGFNWNFHSAGNATGNGIGLFLGGTCDMEFSKSLGLVGNLYVFDNKYGSYNGNGLGINYVTLEGLLKWNLNSSKFYFLSGLGFGFCTGSSPSGITNTNVRIEVKAGAGYNFEIGKMVLSPFITAGYGFTDVVSNSDWKIFTIQAGANLKFPII